MVGKAYIKLISIISSKGCADHSSIPPKRGFLLMEETMKAPEERPEVKLLGKDGNVFFILGTVSKERRQQYGSIR